MIKDKPKIYRVYGLNNVMAVLENGNLNISEIIISENSKASKNKYLSKILSKIKLNKTISSKREFDKSFGTYRTQGIVLKILGPLTKDLPSFHKNSHVCLLVLDQIVDPQNIGQIIRTSECAGINGIILPKHHSAPISDIVLQVSQGAFASIPIYEVVNINKTINDLKNEDFWIIGVENSIKSDKWTDIDYKGKTVIVLGSEGTGIRKKVIENCDFLVTIPMQGEINSLNVSAATSVILFERLRQILNN